MHLDICPSNLLVIDNIENMVSENKDGSSEASESNRHLIHITNFCISSGFLRKKFSSNQISSLFFMAPERIGGEVDPENHILAARADVWSVGVLLFLIVFGKPPFDGRLNTALVKSIKTGTLKLKDNRWDSSLKLFVDFIGEMLRTGPLERISVIGALNHEFLRKDYSVLKELSFRRQKLQALEDFWASLMLKNEIKNFAQFMASCAHPSSMMERIFEAKQAQNITQVLNGLSYITDDLTLARFIVEAGFPVDFNDQSNADRNCPDELQITAPNVCQHFLKTYETVYEKQISFLLQYYLKKNDYEA